MFFGLSCHPTSAPPTGRSQLHKSVFFLFLCVHVVVLFLVLVSETSGTPLGRKDMSAFGHAAVD